MKKQGLTLIAVLSLALAGSAFAQSSREVRANVPFDFVVNHTTLPAGSYSITTMGGGNQILVVRGLDAPAVRLANANSIEASTAATRTKLVFHLYEGRYFLSQIWTEGESRGRMLPKSSLESEVALDSTSHDVILYASVR
jgi:hypothetical protein